MFRVALPPIIRSEYYCIYSIWYLSHRYCYLPLSWKSWNRLECAVGGVRQDFKIFANEGSTFVSPYVPAAFVPPKIFLLLFSLKDLVDPRVIMRRKDNMSGKLQ
jgi:hypothetical protein